ncbi:MAG: LAGLIDADG family homing endonuclease [Patescibacteria group bacterium]
MARAWTTEEEHKYRQELSVLYERGNLSIGQIARRLGIAQQTVFKRIRRLGLVPHPERKSKYRNTRNDIRIPDEYSDDLAEFIGIMLGDGHLSHFQVVVTLGTKEIPYTRYVRRLITKIFKAKASISIRADGYRDVYLGSTVVTKWLRTHGLVSNKVLGQVAPPEWIFTKPSFKAAFVRGMFDTDGSVYRLRFGAQVSFSNRSMPLLRSLQLALRQLQYTPSEISGYQLYLTKNSDLRRFFTEIRPRNQKHVRRFKLFMKELKVAKRTKRAGTQAVNEDRL